MTRVLDVSFASEDWRRAIRDRKHPGMFVRRHLEWWCRFGPASGSDPKLADAFFRYTLTTFTYGSNLGPAQAARHMAGVSAHELGATFRRHMSIGKLNEAIADVVDAFTELDLVRAWGDGATVAADGTQVETFIDNLTAVAAATGMG